MKWNKWWHALTIAGNDVQAGNRDWAEGGRKRGRKRGRKTVNRAEMSE